MTPDQEKKKQELLEMDRLLKRIAAFRGVLVADRAEAAMLFAAFIIFTINSYYNPIPLYLCVFDLIIPLVLHEIQKKGHPTEKEDEASLPLPLLRKKYKYSDSYSRAHSFNFILMTLLLFIWNQSLVNTVPEYPAAKSIPLLLLIMYVLIRLFFWAYYLILFRFFTIKAIK